MRRLSPTTLIALPRLLVFFGALAPILLLAERTRALPLVDDADPPRPSLVIVAPSALARAAEAWAVRRGADGWDVTTLLLDPEAAESSDPSALRTRLAAWLAEVDSVDSFAPAILLLGDVPATESTEAFAGVPTFSFDQPDPRLIDRSAGEAGRIYVSDRPYALPDGAVRPIASIGRVPARSVDEALVVLRKVIRHEDEASHGPWRSHLTFVAGEGRFGAGDIVLETLFRRLVGELIDPAMSLSMTYASASSIYCPPPSRLESIVRDRFAEPALMAIYLGHGHIASLDRMHWGSRRVPLLHARSIESLDEPTADAPIVFLGCCSSGWYDLQDGRRSLAEVMLLTPGASPAVIAGSRMTHPYGTAALLRTLTDELTTGRPPTVGELDRRAVAALFATDDALRTLDVVTAPIARAMGWNVSLPQLRRMHARLYNLLGDPSMRVALPPPPLTVKLGSDELRFEIDGFDAGTAVVEIETRRDSNVHDVHGRRLFAPLAAEQNDLEAIARRNYPRANERLLSRIEVSLSGPRHEIPLPNPLPAGAAILRLHVDGSCVDGTPIRRIAGLLLPTTAPKQPASTSR